jgi:putative FmdB family regulatory protein
MPVYEYECPDCGAIIEVVQSIKQAILPFIPCNECDSAAKKIMSPTSFKLVGDGWPTNDARKFT